MSEETIELGDTAEDKITGFKGVVIARSEWLYGCVRLTLQPRSIKEGETTRYSSETFDEPQCSLVEKETIKVERPAAPRKHGPKQDPRRH